MSLLRQCCCEELPPPEPCECESSEDWPSSFVASGVDFDYEFDYQTPWPGTGTCGQACSQVLEQRIQATVSTEVPIVMNRIGTSCNYYGVGTVSVTVDFQTTHETRANPVCNGIYTTSGTATVEVPCCLHITCHYEKVCGCGEDMTTNPARCKGPAVYYHKLEICDFTVSCNTGEWFFCDCDPTEPSTVLTGLSCNGVKLVYASNFAPILSIGPADCVSQGWYGPCKNAVCPSCTYCPFGCCGGDCNEADITLNIAGPFSIARTDPCDENEPPDPCTDLNAGALFIQTSPRPNFPGNVSALLTNTNGAVDEQWTATVPVGCPPATNSLLQFGTPCFRPWIYT